MRNICERLFLYFRILKKKLKNEKMANRNSEKSEKSEISEKLFRVFLFPSVRFCPTAKIENWNLKILEKFFRNFRDFQGFQGFHLAFSFIELLD